MKGLNIGCGSCFDPDWTNCDFKPVDRSVLKVDARRRLPFVDGSFEVVYHSHVLEHLSAEAGTRFLRECHRVTKSGGILRVVVPDLENLARSYVEALERARSGDEFAVFERDWLTLELFDQVGRNEPGGEIKKSAETFTDREREYVIGRWGREALWMFDTGKEKAGRCELGAPSRIKGLFRLFLKPAAFRELLKKWALGREYRVLQLGRFRESGETHCRMYDADLLGRELEAAGFVGARVRAADESAVERWRDYGLDTEADGRERKPDSLYMEADRP